MVVPRRHGRRAVGGPGRRAGPRARRGQLPHHLRQPQGGSHRPQHPGQDFGGPGGFQTGLRRAAGVCRDAVGPP
eukprot:5484007-Lingulodinium_polyedra.AAC.1